MGARHDGRSHGIAAAARRIARNREPSVDKWVEMPAQVHLLEAVDGEGSALGRTRSLAIRRAASLIRNLPEGRAAMLIELLDELARDDYLGRVRPFEVPAVKILAEVINGWDPDGVYEFARAWTSTLVAREDDFDWETADLEAQRRHRERVLDELARRGLRWVPANLP